MRQGYPVCGRDAVDGDFRQADASRLAAALQAARADTLATFAALERGLDALQVPHRDTLNPPLWELGHLGWFQEYWVGRNPQRRAGTAADPDAPRGPSGRPAADALYDSSRVAHATRWSLPLPDADGTRSDLARQLDGTLGHLLDAAGDDGLYFFRLVLAHEDMHHEAALCMAQSLGIAIDDPRWRPARADDADLDDPEPSLAIAAGPRAMGAPRRGFQFDNELGPHEVVLAATAIDRRAVRWSGYLPFVDAGGYRDASSWTAEGRAWLDATHAVGPRDLRRTDGRWQQCRHGAWNDVDPTEAACHLTRHEAEAWCRWAGRRLPTEVEWEIAATEHGTAFRWGEVWEWTASPFAPYPGFVPHPYRDYSAPWFGNRAVLRGASCLTQPRLRDVRYRNFFHADRNDVAAGFRTCPR